MDEKRLWDYYSAIQKDRTFSFGPYYSYQFRNSPRHILFTISRYKFAMKMIGPGKRIIELGCNEGIGTYYLAEFALHVHGVDFDKEAIEWARTNLGSEKITFQNGNFINKKYGEFDAVVSFDVIEHIYQQNEQAFLETVVENLNKSGISIIGTPNIESKRFANPEIKDSHVNLYSGERLCEALNKYFHNVFLFSMNDELIHTGYAPMSHYLLALCTYKK